MQQRTVYLSTCLWARLVPQERIRNAQWRRVQTSWVRGSTDEIVEVIPGAETLAATHSGAC